MNMLSILGFTGAFRDPVTTGLPLGNGYRWYLPALMRFNAPDSLSPFKRGGRNPYIYCRDDPITRIDPTGHISWFPAGNDVSMLVTRAAEQDADRAISATQAAEAARRAAAAGHETAPRVHENAEQAGPAAAPYVERTMIAVKKPLLYSFYFVEDAPETVLTREGPKKANIGDAVFTGIEGEQWPIAPDQLNARYEFVGAAGVATPSAVPIRVIAEQMSGPFTVTLPWSGEELSLDAHDIKITVEGEPGNSWGVAQSIFAKTYDVREG